MKLFYFCNLECGGRGDWHHAMCMTEEGEVVAKHICSHHGYMHHDLIERSARKAEYDRRWPGSWEAVLVEDVANDPALQAAFAKNQATGNAVKDGAS